MWGVYADSIFDHMGGETQTVYGFQSSISFVNCTFSNILQRSSSIDYDPISEMFRFRGVFAALSTPTSMTAQVGSSATCTWRTTSSGATHIANLSFILQTSLV